ncbi:MAG: hypothetical protein ACFCVC_20375 [Acidimicrobiia bacterium]
MVRIGTTSNATTHHTPAGDTVRLVERTWSCRAEGPGFGFGVWYRRPYRVEVASQSVTVRDPVMTARIVALSAMTLALMWRRSR